MPQPEKADILARLEQYGCEEAWEVSNVLLFPAQAALIPLPSTPHKPLATTQQASGGDAPADADEDDAADSSNNSPTDGNNANPAGASTPGASFSANITSGSAPGTSDAQSQQARDARNLHAADSWLKCRGQNCRSQTVELEFGESTIVSFLHDVMIGSHLCTVDSSAEVVACREGNQVCLKVSHIRAQTDNEHQFWLQTLKLDLALETAPGAIGQQAWRSARVDVDGNPCSLSYAEAADDFPVTRWQLDSLEVSVGVTPAPPHVVASIAAKASGKTLMIRGGDRVPDIFLKSSGISSFELSRNPAAMMAMATVYR